MTPQCTAGRGVRKSGSRDAYLFQHNYTNTVEVELALVKYVEMKTYD